MNILFPMTGPNKFSDDQYMYPKPLIEIGMETMIETAINTYKNIDDCKIYAALSYNDVKEYNLDQVLKRTLEPNDLKITILARETAGSLCTSLLLSEELNEDQELLIVNYDQYVGFNVKNVIEYFRKCDVDFGLVSFESVHPKWSYARIDNDDFVVETAEKKPISKNALAGIYYFKTVNTFKTAAKQTLLDAPISKENFYVSDAINSCILMGAKGKVFNIERHQYRKFYDANEVNEHIRIQDKCLKTETLTKKYSNYFNNFDIDGIAELLSESIELYDPSVGLLRGKEAILNFIKELYQNNPELKFDVKKIIASENFSTIEFELYLGSDCFVGCDLITWEDDKIIYLRAFLEKSNEEE